MFRYVQCDLNHILVPSLNGIKITVGRLTSSAPRCSHYGGHQPTWRAGDTRPVPHEDGRIHRRPDGGSDRSVAGAGGVRSGMRWRRRMSHRPALPAAGASSAASDAGNAGMRRSPPRATRGGAARRSERSERSRTDRQQPGRARGSGGLVCIPREELHVSTGKLVA